MEILEQTKGAVHVLRPVGALAGADADKLRGRAAGACSASMGKVVLDAGAVPFVDSRGLEVLLEIGEALGETGQALRIAQANETLREVLELTELSGHFEHYDDVNAAVRSFM